MKATDKAWLAAAIDGEGTIYISNRKRKDTGGMNRGVRISVVNTSLEFLQKVSQLMFNTPITVERHKPRPGQTLKTCYRSRLSQSDLIKKVLIAIRPYLIIKGHLADKALEIIPTFSWDHPSKDIVKQKRSEFRRQWWANMSGRKRANHLELMRKGRVIKAERRISNG